MALERPDARVRSSGLATLVFSIAALLWTIDFACGGIPLGFGELPSEGESGLIVPAVPTPALESADPADASVGEATDLGQGATAPGPMTWVLAIAALAVLAFVIRTKRWRLASDSGPRPMWSPAAGLGIFLLLLLAGIVGATLALAGTEDRSEIEIDARSILGIVVGQGIVIVWASLVSGRVSDSEGDIPSLDGTLGKRSRSPIGGAIGFGTVAMLLAYPVLATLGQVGLALEAAWRGGEIDPIAHGTLQLLVDGGGALASPWAVMIVLLVVTGIPICEEFAYRGLLQRAFTGWFDSGGEANSSKARWAAIALASVVFALMHLSALPENSRTSSLVLLFAVSLVLGWSYERTGRLAAPIAGHAVFNAINLGVATASP